MIRAAYLCLLLVALACAGCVHLSEPGHGGPVTLASAREELKRLEHSPVPVRRPIVVLSGYHTPSMHASPLAAKLVKATSGREQDVLLVSYPGLFNIDEVAQAAVEEVERRWPCEDADKTIEVDVVGVSMGGIIARWAALPPSERVRAGTAEKPEATLNTAGKRLNVVRLFTYASPHRGATLAKHLAIDDAAKDLKPGSDLLATLDAAWERRGYEITCYAHTRDTIVGATNTAPPGVNPIWTDGTLAFSHFAVVSNPMFISDTARRLRGEEPLLQAAEAPPRD